MVVLAEQRLGRVFTLSSLRSSALRRVGRMTLAAPSGPDLAPGGSVVVAESGRHGIATFERSLHQWRRYGTRGAGVGQFARPRAAAFSGRGLVVADTGNRRIVGLADVDGSGWQTLGPDPSLFVEPRDLAVDFSGGVWVADPGAGRLVRFDALDGTGWAVVELDAGAVPYGVCAYATGAAALDVGRSCVVVVDAVGAVVVETPLTETTWAAPSFVAADGADLIVADVVANALRRLAWDGAAFVLTEELRGSPPDQTQPLFERIGGVG